MKSWMTIWKNLKLLMRSKTSAIVILLAPLLIVLIIAAGFTETDTSLDVGVYYEERTQLTDRFVANLNLTQNVLVYSNTESCITDVEASVVLACIVFPPDFAIGSEGQEITFFVDESRMNLVHRMIAGLSTSLRGEQSEISQEIAQELLGLIEKTYLDTQSQNENLQEALSKLDTISSDIISGKSDLEGVSTNINFLDTVDIESDAANLRSKYDELLNRASLLTSRSNDLLDDLNSSSVDTSSFESALTNMESTLQQQDNSSSSFSDLISAIGDISNEFTRLEIALGEVDSFRDNFGSTLLEVEGLIENTKSDLQEVIDLNNELITIIESLEYTDSRTIAEPVRSVIQTVTSDMDRVTYSFPYLLMLVIMFVGIMLSSNLVFMEKDSRAFFRNYTTPTRFIFFTAMTYLTSMIVIVLQLAVIIGVAYFTLNIPLLNNIGVNLFLLFMSTSLFILLGMLIGYAFKTSEAITMGNITLGSIFLFLSNLILPLETLSPLIKNLSYFNPYVLFSESLRSSLLFSASMASMFDEILLMLLYTLAVFMLIVLVIRISNSSYFENLKYKKLAKKVKSPEDHYLHIEGQSIKGIGDLIKYLEPLEANEFRKLVKQKTIYHWIKSSLAQKRLAKKLRKTKDKRKYIAILKDFKEKL